jgi:mannose-6-phosphate isomerase-like protein (cupin superfamily)
VAAGIFGGVPAPDGLTEEERQAFEALRAQFRKGYIAEQSQSPQSIGYSLNDSPAGLAAWMLDHDTDAYEKISRAFVDDDPSGGLTRGRVLDNITLYWLTETRTSAGRILRGARKISPGNTVIATEEIIYVLEGELEYEIEGQSPRTVKAGEALTVQAAAVHAVRNVGEGDAAELATYIVEKGKPLITLAQ